MLLKDRAAPLKKALQPVLLAAREADDQAAAIELAQKHVMKPAAELFQSIADRTRESAACSVQALQSRAAELLEDNRTIYLVVLGN